MMKAMNVDFLDAHDRHWDDAELLFNAKRWANADHLYGLAAECGLKRLMAAFGMKINAATGAPAAKVDWVHVGSGNGQDLWSRYGSYCQGRWATVYALPAQNPFNNWNVAQRYAHQNNFSQGIVDPHREGAEAVYQLIQKAKIGGLI